MQHYNVQHQSIATVKIAIRKKEVVMINRESTCLSAVSANSNNWLFRTSQLNYILNEICRVVEWFCFGDYK